MLKERGKDGGEGKGIMRERTQKTEQRKNYFICSLGLLFSVFFFFFSFSFFRRQSSRPSLALSRSVLRFACPTAEHGRRWHLPAEPYRRGESFFLLSLLSTSLPISSLHLSSNLFSAGLYVSFSLSLFHSGSLHSFVLAIYFPLSFSLSLSPVLVELLFFFASSLFCRCLSCFLFLFHIVSQCHFLHIVSLTAIDNAMYGPACLIVFVEIKTWSHSDRAQPNTHATDHRHTPSNTHRGTHSER